MILVKPELITALSYDWTAYVNGEPVRPEDLHINTNSIDVHLGDKVLLPSLQGRYESGHSWTNCIDLHDPASVEWRECSFKKTLLRPGNFVLAHVIERIDCTAPILVDGKYRYFIPMLEGRSTVARCGLSIHETAGFGDLKFSSNFTLELSAKLPIVLRAGDRIGQIYFIEVSSGTVGYEGAYQDQHDRPRAPVLGERRI